MVKRTHKDLPKTINERNTDASSHTRTQGRFGVTRSSTPCFALQKQFLSRSKTRGKEPLCKLRDQILRPPSLRRHSEAEGPDVDPEFGSFGPLEQFLL